MARTTMPAASRSHAGSVGAVVLALAGPLVHAGHVSGQVAADVERFERRLEQIQRDTRVRADAAVPVGQRLFADYGAYATAAYLSLDDAGGDNRVLRQYDLVGYARLVLDGAHEAFLRGRYEYRDFHRGDNFDADATDDESDDWALERALYRFDLQRHLGAYGRRAIDDDGDNLVLDAGRDFVYWANGLVLAETLDGARLTLSRGASDVVLLAGVTAPDLAIDVDASRPEFDDDTRRGFYGAAWTTRLGGGRHRPFVYGLIQQDYNDDPALVIGAPGGQTVTTAFEYDSYYLGAGANGSLTDRLAYGAELVYQGGRGLSNSFDTTGGAFAAVDQTREDVHAWAADVRLDYLLPDARRTRLSAELIAASGDDDRLSTSNTFGGNRGGTDDTAFNAFGLVNTGLAFAPAVSNLLAARVGVSTLPAPDTSAFRRLQVGADLFVFAKADAEAPIDEPTDDSRFLGWEPDVFVNWQIASDVSLAVRYGVFFPGDAVLDEDDDVRHFIYAGLTIGL